MHDDLGTVKLVFSSPYLLHAPTVFSETGSGREGEETRGFRSTAEALECQLEAFHGFVARLAEEHGRAIGGEAAQ